MKLPHPLLENVGFMFDQAEDLLRALNDVDQEEASEIRRLFAAALPPVTSIESLAVAFGYNPGFVHSMTASMKAHYRFFAIPKGKGFRNIVAPKVALKGIQKWLSVHFERKYEAPANVYGFVPGRSHLDAAKAHLGAEWVCSVDIENFFPSVRGESVAEALRHLGYETDDSIELLTRLCCLKNSLVQGSPASPVLSNIVLRNLDRTLSDFADDAACTFTRYADDIVMSGTGNPPDNILEKLDAMVTEDGWTVATAKSELVRSPNRLKVHGLLVHSDKIRLTKGYRNKLRAYRHLLKKGQIREADLPTVLGHLNYALQVERANDG